MEQQVGYAVDDFPMLPSVRREWLGLPPDIKTVVENDLAEWLCGVQAPHIWPVQNSRGQEIIYLEFRSSFVVFFCIGDENLIIVSMGCLSGANISLLN